MAWCLTWLRVYSFFRMIVAGVNLRLLTLFRSNKSIMINKMKILFFITCVLLSAANAYCQSFEIYVSDAGNFSSPPWKILKYDEDGDNPEVFINDHVSWPQDIVFLEDKNTVLISSFNTGLITRHNSDTGDYINNFASGISGPTRMKIGADKLLYVLQWNGNGLVRRYELDGMFVDEFTDAGVPQSIGIDWDSAGNLYVSSFNGRSVRKFDSSGRDQGIFIDSHLAGPTNIWFESNGDLLVSDYSGTAVKRFDSDGNYLSDFLQGLSQSEGVDFMPNGNILIGNGASRSVKMFDSIGNFLEDIIPSGSGGLQTPNAVVIREMITEDSFQINPGLNDAWFDPATAGQGFLITVFPDIKQMFLAWFTYDTERPPEDVTAFLGEPGHRWLTAQGSYNGDTAKLTIFMTEGGVFDSAEPVASADPAGYGELTLEFADCTAGLVEYEITSLGITGKIPIQRITLDNVPYCEALGSP